MRSVADLRTTAERNGLRLESVERVPTSDGRTVLVSRMSFRDPWAASRYLVEAAEEDATDPYVRQYALAIMRACRDELGETGPTRSPELLACVAEAIHANVQEQIAFVHERKETFQSARETLELGAGDCDDHARLVKALAMAANLPAELVFFDEKGAEVGEDKLESRHGSPDPVHVAPKVAGEWAETTIGAAFGEDPYEALERLEVETGENPMSHAPDVRGLGFLGLDFVTADNVRDRKAELNAAVVTTHGDIARCADAKTQAAWLEFRDGWDAFFADDPSWWDSGAQGRQAQDYAERIRDWQTRAKAMCAAAGQTAAGIDLPEAKQDPTVSVVKIVAIAGAVIAGALAVREVAKASR